MAKRYEISDEARTLVADLFTETHGRGRPRLMLTPKIHMLSDANGTPLRFLFSGGLARDISYAQPLLNEPSIPSS